METDVLTTNPAVIITALDNLRGKKGVTERAHAVCDFIKTNLKEIPNRLEEIHTALTMLANNPDSEPAVVQKCWSIVRSINTILFSKNPEKQAPAKPHVAQAAE